MSGASCPVAAPSVGPLSPGSMAGWGLLLLSALPAPMSLSPLNSPNVARHHPLISESQLHGDSPPMRGTPSSGVSSPAWCLLSPEGPTRAILRSEFSPTGPFSELPASCCFPGPCFPSPSAWHRHDPLRVFVLRLLFNQPPALYQLC